jgi:hypothetical protein
MEEMMEARPEYVDQAFRMVYYGGQYEQALEAFAQHWGGFESEAVTNALTTGTGEERALAIFILGYSGNPQARELLLPFLESADPMEQWASALALGAMRQEEALPVLMHLLDEFLPPRAHPLEREGGLYHSWRIKVAALLGEWGRTDLVPILRQALQKSWTIEQADITAHKQVWHSYEDELVYALGQLEAFGALTGLPLPSSRLHLWMVMLSCGFLRARTRYGDLLTQVQINVALQGEITRILEQRFGLSRQEQEDYIDSYADGYFSRMEWK